MNAETDTTCTHGTEFRPGHRCRHCARELRAGVKAFARAVKRGQYNRRGYTRREWAAAGLPIAAWKSAKPLPQPRLIAKRRAS